MTATSDRLVRYDKLKEDFKFNLGLIEDRDLELGRYEAALQGMKDCLRDKVRRFITAEKLFEGHCCLRLL